MPVGQIHEKHQGEVIGSCSPQEYMTLFALINKIDILEILKK